MKKVDMSFDVVIMDTSKFLQMRSNQFIKGMGFTIGLAAGGFLMSWAIDKHMKKKKYKNYTKY